MMHVFKRISFVLLCGQTLGAVQVDVHTRFGVGPAWHSFSSAQYFSIVGNPFIQNAAPQIQYTLSNYFLMPYGQYDGSLTINNALHGKAFIGGGATTHARGIISSPFSIIKKTLLSLDKDDCSVESSILIFDAQLGYLFNVCSCGTTINPSVGFVINDEKVLIVNQVKESRFRLKNYWFGPYIGVALQNDLSEAVDCSVFYKLVFSELKSKLAFTPGKYTLPVQSPCSVRTANALGSILGFVLRYQPHDSYALGVSGTYMSYKNRTCGRVRFFPTNREYVANSYIKSIAWKQILMTVFFELDF